MRLDHARSALAFAALLLTATATVAKVAPGEAERLAGDLTPLGAERAGNTDGRIPEWRGGLTQPPPCFEGAGQRYCDPYADDEPLYTVTAENLEAYSALLTPGQVALFERHPQTYRMRVYPTRRSFANPAFVYEATRQNAVSAELGGNGEALIGAVTGIPFPIPGNAQEVIWNHKVRYRDTAVQRWNNQFSVTTAGDFNHVKMREDVRYGYSMPGATPASLENVLYQFVQLTTQPPRLAGSTLLIHETMDQVREARRAWQYSPGGQQRLRRAPGIGYDTPATGADGLRTIDQTDSFNGAMDRYDWKLIGKRELLVPANSYRLHSDALRYAEIIRKGHINPEYPRYELRRVWVVEALLRKNTVHQFRRRTFYLDEDGWQIRVVDLHDSRDQLWRVQETHSVVAYDKPYELPVCETVYDLATGRYLAQGLNNEDPETATIAFTPEHFSPGNVSKMARQ